MDILKTVENNLIVLPGAPIELQSANPFVKCKFGNNKTVLTLFQMNLHGLAVCKRVPLSSYATTLTDHYLNANNVAHACMFIPAPSFDKILLIKNVNDLTREGSISQISDSIRHQINHLNNVADQLKPVTKVSSDKHCVQLLVSCLPKVKNSPDFNKLELSIRSIVNIESQKCTNLELSNVQFFNNKALVQQISNTLSQNGPPQEIVQNLVVHCLTAIQQEEFYHLSKRQFRFLAGLPLTFEHVDEMIQRLNFYFPNRNDKLTTVPHFNQIMDNMLFSYKDDGEPGQFNDYASYLGEVRLFSEKLLRSLTNPKGVLLKSFSRHHLKTILSPEHLTPQDFEIDWLYLGCRYIVAIEVGIAENRQDPKTAICNKIIQSLQNTIPQLLLTLYSFWKSFQQMPAFKLQQGFVESVKNLFKVVIFLPGVKYFMLAREVKVFREKYEALIEDGQLHPEQFVHDDVMFTLLKSKQSYSSLVFMIEVDGENSDLKLVSLTNDLELKDSELTVEELFSGSNSRENKLFSYFCSLFWVASLNGFGKTEDASCNDSVSSVDSRFFVSFKKWFEKKRKEKTIIDEINSELILSPQQHQILSKSDNTHLIITGQPGSGKTSLLLAKCEQITTSNDNDKIYVICDKKKVLFKKYLDRSIEYCTQDMKTKTKILGINSSDLESTVKKLADKKRVAIMIDEIDAKIILPNQKLGQILSCFKYCWISLTETGSYSNYSNLRLDFWDKLKFQHEDLCILFRSASHISQITHNSIEKQNKKLPFPSKPVRIPGCFTAAQLEIPVKYLGNIESVLNKSDIDDFIQEKFSDRLVVIAAAKLPDRFSHERLKSLWNANEVIYCSHIDEIDCISGSEFHSVWFIVDCGIHITENAFSLVLSRAQYEAGIVLIKTGPSDDVEIPKSMLSSYLLAERCDYVVLYEQIVHNNKDDKNRRSALTNWLSPNDTQKDDWRRWWEERLDIQLTNKRGETIESLKRQPITIRLQLTCSFYKHFFLPTDTSSTHEGKESIVSKNDLISLDNEEIAELNLLYWSVLSLSDQSVNNCIEFLRMRNLLSNEINKGYPNATILHVISSVRREMNLLKMVIACKELQNVTLFQKFDKKTVFELMLAGARSPECFWLLFSDPQRWDLFFKEQIGFESEDSENKSLEKYKKWDGNILFNVIKSMSKDVIKHCLANLREYNYILQYELSRIQDGETLLQHALSSLLVADEYKTLCVMKLIIEEGFPYNLLLHERVYFGVSENVLDTAIRKERWKIFDYLLLDGVRRQQFLSSNKGVKYSKRLRLTTTNE